MKRTLLAFTAAALAFTGEAHAQAVGGPDAKGNAPLKRPHTIDDGAAKHGANSFTEGQARKHIENAGYTGVSPLAKDDAGVWRGTAVKDGVSRNVGLDFKGNVVDGLPTSGSAPAAAARSSATDAKATHTMSTGAMSAGAMSSGGASSGATTETTTLSDTTTAKAATHHRKPRHHAASRCANPTPNGAACSGVDKNENGISDKEDRAISKGAKP